ncbi:MAG: DUF5806 family protein [Methanomicrobiales archaeon]|nr:DUF5806 family protein [Methanomicrobiales archaeon]
MQGEEGTGDAQKYQKFKKVDGAAYEKVNAFLRKRTYVTAREWAIARLCADFKTTGGSEMTFIGDHLPELVPFMTDTYTPQAVNQARSAFKRKVKKAGATFFYGAMCGFFTAEELDDILFEASEVAKFLLEVEGTSLDIDEEISIEDRITEIMRNVAESAARVLRERETGGDRAGGDEPVREKPGRGGIAGQEGEERNREEENPDRTPPKEGQGSGGEGPDPGPHGAQADPGQRGAQGDPGPGE